MTENPYIGRCGDCIYLTPQGRPSRYSDMWLCRKATAYRHVEDRCSAFIRKIDHEQEARQTQTH